MADISSFSIRFEGVDEILDSYDKINEAHKRELKALRAINDIGSQAYKDQQKVVAQLAAEKKRLNKETREAEQEYKAVSQTVGAYERLSNKLSVTRRRVKDLAAAGETATDEFKTLQKEVQDLDAQLKEIDGSVGQFQRNVGNYPDTLGKLFDTVGGGVGNVGNNILGAIDTFKGLRSALAGTAGSAGSAGSAMAGAGGAISGMGAAGAAAATGGIALLVAATAKAAQEALRLTNQFSRLRAEVANVVEGTSEQIDEYTLRIDALANTFEGVDPQSLIEGVNALNILTGDYAESLRLVEEGLMANIGTENEFLGQLGEYSSVLKDAGLEGEQFVSIITQSIDAGVFSDKGIDSVKEAGIALREMTQPTRDALNAIGYTAEEIQNVIASEGMFTAIQKVSNRLSRFSEDSQEAGMVLADVFKGAGEDAGFAAVTGLAQLNTSMEGLVDTSDAYTNAQAGVLEANQKLSAEKAKLAKMLGAESGQLREVGVQAQAFGVQLLNLGVQAVKFTIKYNPVSIAFRTGNKLLQRAIKLVQRWRGETDDGTKANEDAAKAQKETNAEMDAYIAYLESDEVQSSRKADADRKRTKALEDLNKEKSKENTLDKKKAEQSKQLIATSVAYMDVELAKLKSAFQEAASDLERAGLADQIVQIEEKIKKANSAIQSARNIVKQESEFLKSAGLSIIPSGDSLDEDIDQMLLQVDEAYQKRNAIVEAAIQKSAEAEVKANQKKNAEIKKQEEEALAEEEELEKQRNESLVSIASSSLKFFSDLTKAQLDAQLEANEGNEEAQKEAQIRAAKRSKAIALFEIAINTASAVAKVQAQTGVVSPFVIPAIIAQGALQAGIVAATPIKFQQGGMLEGASHADGGIPFSVGGRLGFEAEGGEAIINKRSMENPYLRQLASAINVAGGGKAFAQGGMVSSPDTTLSIDPLSDRIEQLIAAQDRRIDRIRVIAKPDEIVREGNTQINKRSVRRI